MSAQSELRMHDLSKRREAQLFNHLRMTGDPGTRETLVRRYLPLARHTARRFQRPIDSFDDVYQVACYALLKAVDRFDPDRGLAFTTYAIPTMVGELKRYARDTGWGVRVPRGLQDRVLEVDQAITDLTGRLGRSPTAAEVAAERGLTTEELLEIMEAAAGSRFESLDTPLGAEAEAATRLDTIGGPDPHFDLMENAHAIGSALRALEDRERTILRLRFGEELSQSQIARRLGISQMHVSRLLRRTLDRLAEEVEEQALAG